jgi:hypothetical protein
MVKASPRELGLLAGALLAVGIGWARLSPPRGPASPETPPRAAAAASVEVPAIDLARLEASPLPLRAGRRNVFGYGALPITRQRAAVMAPAPPPTPPPQFEAPLVTDPTPPPVPPLSVKFIGAMENKQGLKVAVLITDRKEILTGQAGDVVGNRLRILKIGLESVDVQDVGGGAVRRLPLRGN